MMGLKIPAVLKQFIDRGQYDYGHEMVRIEVSALKRLNDRIDEETRLSFALREWADKIEEITSQYESDLEEVWNSLVMMGNPINLIDRAATADSLRELMSEARSRYHRSLKAAKEKFENKMVAS